LLFCCFVVLLSCCLVVLLSCCFVVLLFCCFCVFVFLFLFCFLLRLLEIFLINLSDNNRVVFDGELSSLSGKPFTIVDCCLSKSGSVRCLVQHIEDATFTPTNPHAQEPLSFVRESEGDFLLSSHYLLLTRPF
jgi:hypothetical protein